MAEFTAEFGLNGFDHVADLTGQIWVVFGVSAQPSFVFINDDGTIKRHVGGMTPQELDAQMAWLEAN
jgi:hypothetical protein